MQSTSIKAELKYALDPVAWIHELGLLRDKQDKPCLLDPKQQEILSSGHKRLIVCCHRHWGKSTVSSLLCLHRALHYPRSLSLLVAPSLRQSSETFRKVLDSLDIQADIKLVEDTRLSLKLSNRSRIVSLPGTQKTVRGFSNPDIIVIDEAAQAKDELYQALMPMLAVNADGRIILCSTPWGQSGFFFKIWTEGGPEWLKIKVVAADNPRITPGFLEEQRHDPGHHGPFYFQQEFECEFVANESCVFNFDMIKKALNSDVPIIDI